MATARFYNRDMYLMEIELKGAKRWMCVCCKLIFTTYQCETPEGMIEHIRLHKSHGHEVPEKAMDRLDLEAIGLRMIGLSELLPQSPMLN
jgi:hypothetical protein